MKKILGLDLGTTSIGWAMVRESENKNERSSIEKLGVRLNPLTVDELQNFEKGKSITSNADRTLKRSMRRNLQRYKLRRENLIEILIEKNIITKENILSEKLDVLIKENIVLEINEHLKIAFNEEIIVSSIENELSDVYKHVNYIETKPLAETENIRLIDAISLSLKQCMRKHNNLVIMGQDIAEYGGVFKITDGFLEEFGAERIRNTPICESTIIEAAYGLSINGNIKAVVELQFSDFITSGFNPVINLLAKSYYRWRQGASVVLRMPCGAGVNAGPFHSQSNEAWFTHTPGLKVLYPSNPYDAKGLLNAAFNDPNPVLFFEHKVLYRSISAPVPDAYYTIEIGKAATVLSGDDISIISYGAGVHWVTAYAAAHPEVSIELLDLRSLLPLDYDAIRACVEKTGKVLIVHEDTLFGGIGGELSAWITEHCFKHLDAPVMRCASLDTPVPFAIPLEQNFLAKSRLEASIQKLLNY